MKINETPIDMPDIDDKAQEFIDFEKDLYEPSREIKKLNKKKRKKVLTNTEVQPKKIKLSKVEDSKLKKKKLVNTWVETDITPEEISVNVSNSSQSVTMNGGSSDPEMENVINSTTGKDITKVTSTFFLNNFFDFIFPGPFTVTEGWETPLQEGEIEYVISKSNTKQRLSDANEKFLSDSEDSQPKQVSTPIANKKQKLKSTLTSTPTPTPTTPSTPANTKKKVKIILQLNRSQDLNESIRQLRSSAKIPYDSAKKPGKGLLKPNLPPSPINPHYKKKIGLEF